MASTDLLAPFVEPLVLRLREWQGEGKLALDDLDRVLSPRARALVEGAVECRVATPLADVETLIALVATQLGDEAALADLGAEIASFWPAHPPIDALVRGADRMVDGCGFVASQTADWLLADADWTYSGGREGFELRLAGLADASPALRALLGAMLLRTATAVAPRGLALRLEGVDGPELSVVGRSERSAVLDPSREARLHRAALVG